jgi:hypothetical protein
MLDPEGLGVASGRGKRAGAQDNGIRVRRWAQLHAQCLLQLPLKPKSEGDYVLHWEQCGRLAI